jgi:hypothetical protein
LLLICKQGHAEAHNYFQGVVDGTIYWSLDHDFTEDYCEECFAYHRTKTLVQIARTLHEHEDRFQHIRHLDLSGNGIYNLILDMMDAAEDKDEDRLDDRAQPGMLLFLCTQRLLERVRVLLQNVESVTVYGTATLLEHWHLAVVFPKLRTVLHGDRYRGGGGCAEGS